MVDFETSSIIFFISYVKYTLNIKSGHHCNLIPAHFSRWELFCCKKDEKCQTNSVVDVTLMPNGKFKKRIDFSF